MAKSRECAQHVVMRFADSLFNGVNTIQEHRKVIDRRGAVWVAKVGKPLAQYKIGILREQIRQGIPTYLFLVQRLGRVYSWTRATLVELGRTVGDDQQAMIPSYYRAANIVGMAEMWFKVSDLVKAPAAQVRQLHVVSSGRPIAETLAGSMAAMFMVASGRPTSASISEPRPKKRRQSSLERAILEDFDDDDF